MKQPVLAMGMRVTFSINMGANTGGTGGGGLEGLVFHLQGQGVDELSLAGLGYHNNFANDFAIELDCKRSATFDASTGWGHPDRVRLRATTRSRPGSGSGMNARGTPERRQSCRSTTSGITRCTPKARRAH